LTWVLRHAIMRSYKNQANSSLFLIINYQMKRKISLILSLILIFEFGFPQVAFSMTQKSNNSFSYLVFKINKAKSDLDYLNNKFYVSNKFSGIKTISQPAKKKIVKKSTNKIFKSYENKKGYYSNSGYKTSKSSYVTVTGYSSTPDQCSGNPFITASGTRVHSGTLACNFLPFGTKVRFPEYSKRVFIVEDRMGYSRRADIWFTSRSEALKFGKRRLKMEIL